MLVESYRTTPFLFQSVHTLIYTGLSTVRELGEASDYLPATWQTSIRSKVIGLFPGYTRFLLKVSELAASDLPMSVAQPRLPRLRRASVESSYEVPQNSSIID